MENNDNKSDDIKYAYFASGCFWGTEYWFRKAKGVLHTSSGYTGGSKENPTYKEVCNGATEHLEAVSIEYNSKETGYDDLVKLFFETHNYSQANGQGPDIGAQYLSAIFYETDEEKETAEKYINILKSKGHDVATSLKKLTVFWVAEDYHQNYYNKKNIKPPCHAYNKIF